jgi:hypothetical protein
LGTLGGKDETFMRKRLRDVEEFSYSGLTVWERKQFLGEGRGLESRTWFKV